MDASRYEPHIDPPTGPRVSPREEGDPQSTILVFAEAPAVNEMRQGRPLVGTAGQTWNNLMHNAGLIRRQVYILNLFPMIVEKGNAGKEIYIRGRPDQVLWTSRLGFTDLAIPHLRSAFRKIRQSKANVIITLGQTATQTLCPHIKSIQKWRGSPLMTDVESTGLRRKVIPTYHPAALSWGAPYIWRYDIIADLRKVKKESVGKRYTHKEPDIIIRPRLKDVLDFTKGCRAARLVNTDIECYGRTVTCFSLAWNTDAAISIPLMNEEGGPYWSEPEEIVVWQEYAKLMGDPTITKVNQNMLFDMWILFMANKIVTRGPIEDPMIMQGILYPDFPKKLEYITSLHADMPYYKDDKKLWKNFWKDIENFWRYNARDSIASLRCKLSLEKEIFSKGYSVQYLDYIQDCKSLLYMMCRGVSIDSIALQKVRTHVESLLRIKETELTGHAGQELNALSNKQMIQYFYVEKGYRPYFNIKTKKPTVDDLALTRIVHKYKDKAARTIQEIRRLNKLKGTYYDVVYDDDNRIRTSYIPTGTGHGRLSSKKSVFGDGLDMQNLDPEFKAFIIPGKDPK